MTQRISSDPEEMHRLAAAFRQAARNPARTLMPAEWVEGFTDGLRFAAAALDVIVDGDSTVESLLAILQSA